MVAPLAAKWTRGLVVLVFEPLGAPPYSTLMANSCMLPSDANLNVCIFSKCVVLSQLYIPKFLSFVQVMRPCTSSVPKCMRDKCA